MGRRVGYVLVFLGLFGLLRPGCVALTVIDDDAERGT